MLRIFWWHDVGQVGCELGRVRWLDKMLCIFWWRDVCQVTYKLGRVREVGQMNWEDGLYLVVARPFRGFGTFSSERDVQEGETTCEERCWVSSSPPDSELRKYCKYIYIYSYTRDALYWHKIYTFVGFVKGGRLLDSFSTTSKINLLSKLPTHTSWIHSSLKYFLSAYSLAGIQSFYNLPDITLLSCFIISSLRCF